MINVQELFHEKMYKQMNQCLLFEQNMDLGRKYTLNFYKNEISISDIFYGPINSNFVHKTRKNLGEYQRDLAETSSFDYSFSAAFHLFGQIKVSIALACLQSFRIVGQIIFDI